MKPHQLASQKLPFVVRFLLAVSFVILSVSGALIWTVGREYAAWWVPFAVAVFFPAVMAVVFLIIGGPEMFHDR